MSVALHVGPPRVLACTLRFRVEPCRPILGTAFIPTRTRVVVSKQAMVRTIERAAINLSIPLAAPDGCERVSGHSLRVSGAQGLARMGWDFWAIQLHGRWHSDVVKHYVREAHLTPVGGAAYPGDGPTLEHIVDAVLRKLGKHRQADA